MSRRDLQGFTLVELLVSLAVGLVVVQIAFASFFIVRKYVNRIQRLEAATNILQAAVTWYGFNGAASPPPELTWVSGDYSVDIGAFTPIGEDKIRRMPHRIIGNLDSSGHLVIYDLSSAAWGAKQALDKRGITGWERLTPNSPDPRYLAEVQLK